MMTGFATSACMALSIVVTSSAGSQDRRVVPGAKWDSIGADSRWSPDSLRRIGAMVDSMGSGAVMVVDDGRVVAGWGAPSRKFPIASVRKSLLHALLGIEMGRGTISLDATLAQLDIDDEPPLTATEKAARVTDLLASRSGVYHEAAYETQSARNARPVRGSAAPGEKWYYNNWDFNVLGAIYERASGKKIFAAFDELIARSLEMEDYRSSDGEYLTERGSRFPAYTFRMSARDLARVGLLYLRRGAWHEKQIVPAAWVDQGVHPRSDAGSGGSYGMLWWAARDGLLVPGVSLEDGTFAARGNGPHYMIVIPARQLVIVHLADTETPSPDRWVDRDAVGRLVSRILAAKRP
jgi:CubicO group peptidase (beta-lactamase class C family)